MKSSQNKFGLLYLEEGEHYIQDFFGKINFFDLVSQSYRQSDDAVIHFSSRSLMIEFPKDNSQPLYKYLLKYFEGEPIFDKS